MSGILANISVRQIAQCFLGAHRREADIDWMVRMINTMSMNFLADGCTGFEWIVAYGMVIFHNHPDKSNLAALASVCIAAKLLDDLTPEIGCKEWEAQIPGLSAERLCKMEKNIALHCNYRFFYSMQQVEQLVHDRAHEVGIAITI